MDAAEILFAERWLEALAATLDLKRTSGLRWTFRIFHGSLRRIRS
jgi:hypothetical protein